MIGDLRAGAAAARVTEQREVRPPRASPTRVVEHRELAELDEVVAAAARAELRPRAILHPGGDRRDAQSASITSCSRRDLNVAPCRTRFPLEHVREARLLVGERARPADRAPSASCGTRCRRRPRTG